MLNKNQTPFLFIQFFLICIAMDSHSQVTIKGPACVVPGTLYQYVITANWDTAAKMQVCITGGSMISTKNKCTLNTRPVPFVQVSWDSAATGSINVTSSQGTASKNVTITTLLSGGAVTSGIKKQAVSYNVMPGSINCSAASGGGCSPGYSYQWQESSDNVNWTDVKGATGQNFDFSSARKQMAFFRRKVTETKSGAIAYSDTGVVDVGPPPAPVEKK